MSAAALTPTSVQKTYLHSTNKYGTPVRIIEYTVVVTKVTQSDWIVAATYTPGTYIGCVGFTIDGSGNGAIETMTYAASGTTILMGSANVGTAYLKVYCLDVGA